MKRDATTGSRGAANSERTRVQLARCARSAVAVAVVLGSACAAPVPPASGSRALGSESGVEGPRWNLFVPDGPGAVFAPRIRLWQASERLARLQIAYEARAEPALIARPASSAPERPRAASLAVADRGTEQGLGTTLARSRDAAVAEGSAPPALALEVGAFSLELKRAIADRTLEWVQAQSRRGYRRDPNGDEWPILQELLGSGRDDCDGWELLQFSTLRSFGFEKGEIFRGILEREEPRAYHMVTLWLPERSAADPWVLDPIGSIAQQPVRLSALEDWAPLRVFDEDDQFGVVRRR